MTNEPNNEQARELSEKELEGIAGGAKTIKVHETPYTLNDDMVAVQEGIIHDTKVAVFVEAARGLAVT